MMLDDESVDPTLQPTHANLVRRMLYPGISSYAADPDISHHSVETNYKAAHGDPDRGRTHVLL